MPPGSVQDSQEAFLPLPWASSLLNGPDTTVSIPGSRVPKHHIPGNEDSLFASLLKQPSALSNCICLYPTPSPSDPYIPRLHLLVQFGNDMNGHRDIMHGGIVASLLDEAMGVLQSANHMRDHLLAKERGLVRGDLPREGMGSFTVTLKVTYKAPVKAPGTACVTVWFEKREGRKDWINGEVRQWGDDGKGEGVVCGLGEGFFVEPRKDKL